MSREYELAFRMKADLDAKFSKSFSSASEKIDELERKLHKLDNTGQGNGGFGKRIVTGLGNIGRAAGMAAGMGIAAGIAATGYAVTNSIQKAMGFEAQMSSIGALTGASNAELAKMQSLALKMGANTKYSALEAAQGIEELLKAGLTPAAVQAGGLEAALNLATAGSLELASAAEIMSTALNAYKKDSMTAAQASNILAGTANASATSVEDLQYSLAAVSAVAAGVGLTFKDTNIALGLFANNGLKGSDAGTSLKTMLMNLQPKTKEQIALFKKLGLVTAAGANAFYDQHGNIKSLEDISGELRNALKKQTAQQRAMTLETMFGSDAVRAANILFNEGAEGVEKFQKEMSKVTALDVAKRKMDNAAGAVEQFKGALETLQISALLPTMPIIKDLATAAANFAERYAPQIAEGVQKAVDKAKHYVKDHFIDNPEFQKADGLVAKVGFIFDDLWSTFKKWLDSEGSALINKVAEKATKALADALVLNAPIIIDAAWVIAREMGASIVPGILEGIKQSKGVNAVRDALGTNDKFTETSKNVDKWLQDPNREIYTGPLTAPVEQKKSGWDKVGNFFGGVGDFLKGDWLNGYAEGGYVNRPELAWVGEGRHPEWIIPENNSKRSRDMWATAGARMGLLDSGGGAVFNFNITVNGGDANVASQVKQAVAQAGKDFESQYDSMMAQRRRVSFG